MGFLGQLDQNFAKYRIGIRMKKWWWAPFATMLNRREEDRSHSQLSFRGEIMGAIFLKYYNDGARNRQMRRVSISHVPDDV